MLVLVIWSVRVVAVADVFGLFNHWTIFLLRWTVAVTVAVTAATALPSFFFSLGPGVYACETVHAPSPAIGPTSQRTIQTSPRVCRVDWARWSGFELEYFRARSRMGTCFADVKAFCF